MSKGKIVHAGNYAVEVKEGKTYYWCQCGESSNQPFCDGSHSKTDFDNVAFTQKNLVRYIFVVVNRPLINLFVMEVTLIYKKLKLINL